MCAEEHEEVLVLFGTYFLGKAGGRVLSGWESSLTHSEAFLLLKETQLGFPGWGVKQEDNELTPHVVRGRPSPPQAPGAPPTSGVRALV